MHSQPCTSLFGEPLGLVSTPPPAWATSQATRCLSDGDRMPYSSNLQEPYMDLWHSSCSRLSLEVENLMIMKRRGKKKQIKKIQKGQTTANTPQDIQDGWRLWVGYPLSCPKSEKKCALKPPPNQPTHGIPDAGSVSSGQRPCPQARAQDAGYLYLKHPEVSCFQTSLKMNGWNLQITHLERNMIETNPP